MTLTIELPNNFTEHDHAAREVLEAFAIEGYRTEALSHSQAASLLEMSSYDFEGLLKARGVLEGAYSLEALEQDIKTGDYLRSQGLLAR